MIKAFVGGDCYHTILTSNRQFSLTSLIGAMAIAPYGFFKFNNLLCQNGTAKLVKRLSIC